MHPRPSAIVCSRSAIPPPTLSSAAFCLLVLSTIGLLRSTVSPCSLLASIAPSHSVLALRCFRLHPDFTSADACSVRLTRSANAHSACTRPTCCNPRASSREVRRPPYPA
ncbi:hypothetical protein BV20DRAFT_120122 [Pilatotrama ljubarskyi]|nr:hypothetical protein BV20DRAFT_120122 [Pilatotrama ljubarskyi]